jgi:hypothetical protein
MNTSQEKQSMNDVELNSPMTVHTEGDAGPYLMVTLAQLPAVEEILRVAQIRYTVARDAIQLDEHDPVAIIDFGRRADAGHIQAVLDAH